MPKFKGLIVNNRPLMEVFILPFDSNNYPGIPAVILQETQTIYSFKALIDTGATNSCIDSKVVQNLNLLPSGARSMQSATHIVKANVYNIQLGIRITEPLMDIDGKSAGGQIHTKFFPVKAIEAANLHNQGIDALIGMDIIKHCLFIVEEGQFTFCF